MLGFAEKALTTAKKLHKVVKILQYLAKVTKAISTAQLILGSKDAISGVGNFFQVVFSDASGQEKWDATYNMINGLKPYIGPAIKLKMALDSRRNEPKAPENPADTDTDTAKAGTTPKKDQTNCGDPIDMVTGSQRMSNTDFVVKDLSGEFRLVRTYESLYKNEGGILGERWFFNIEARIWTQGERVTALLPDMHLEHFRKTVSVKASTPGKKTPDPVSL